MSEENTTNNNHNHNNNNTCSTASSYTRHTVGESCVFVVAAAATRSPAGRSQFPFPLIPARLETPPPPLPRRILQSSVLLSGLETKERIGTECQRPTVLGRNFYLFIFLRSEFLSAYIILYYILLLCVLTADSRVLCDIFTPYTHITHVWYPPGFIIRPELINCY